MVVGIGNQDVEAFNIWREGNVRSYILTEIKLLKSMVQYVQEEICKEKCPSAEKQALCAEWDGAVAEAKRQRPGRLPDYAYTFAGHTSGAKLPERAYGGVSSIRGRSADGTVTIDFATRNSRAASRVQTLHSSNALNNAPRWARNA